MSEEEEYRQVYKFRAIIIVIQAGFLKTKRVLRRRCQEHFVSGVGFSIMRARIRSGHRLPDLLKVESELCSPIIRQLKANN